MISTQPPDVVMVLLMFDMIFNVFVTSEVLRPLLAFDLLFKSPS